MSGWLISFVITAVVTACAPLRRQTYRSPGSGGPESDAPLDTRDRDARAGRGGGGAVAVQGVAQPKRDGLPGR
jgi:hypothetical protein